MLLPEAISWIRWHCPLRVQMKARIAERQKKAGDEEGAGGEGPAEEAEDFATTMARKASNWRHECLVSPLLQGGSLRL